MNNSTNFKVGDFIEVIYKDNSELLGKKGIIIEIPQKPYLKAVTILEDSSKRTWSKSDSIKIINTPLRSLISKIKKGVKKVFDNNQIDNLTYIELLAKLNEYLTESKKPL